jgi:hypothetical protein
MGMTGASIGFETQSLRRQLGTARGFPLPLIGTLSILQKSGQSVRIALKQRLPYYMQKPHAYALPNQATFTFIGAARLSPKHCHKLHTHFRASTEPFVTPYFNSSHPLIPLFRSQSLHFFSPFRFSPGKKSLFRRRIYFTRLIDPPKHNFLSFQFLLINNQHVFMS